ncbi:MULTISPECIES: hypothetical protein [unclassified Moorena]|nr:MULTISPECIES: hypothetical protein [unclassified Moorena]NEO17603.1 hypothetical protein [Moorena sp. SIO3E8]NEQ04149.1 hypothetical protein [Moorena sp. SIO3F7]
MHAKATPHPISAWNGHHYCVERAYCPLEFSGGTGIITAWNGHIAR